MKEWQTILLNGKLVPIWDDTEFPKINKVVEVNDFVINKTLKDEIEPCSVGVVREINDNIVSILFIGKNRMLQLSPEELVIIDIRRTGKEEGTNTPPFKYKICNLCHIIKNQSTEFEYNQNDKQGRPTTRPSCRNCRVKINGKNMPKSERDRMNAIKPRPHELFKCPICQKLSIPDVTANIVIDHDHRTGLAREWICDSCNTGIGRFQDSPEMLEKISRYIKSHMQD